MKKGESTEPSAPKEVNTTHFHKMLKDPGEHKGGNPACRAIPKRGRPITHQYTHGSSSPQPLQEALALAPAYPRLGDHAMHRGGIKIVPHT